MKSVGLTRGAAATTLLLSVLCVQGAVPSWCETTEGAPDADSGSIRRFTVTSAFLRDDITVDVWTPEGYESSGSRLPVVYTHDGQNLFDGALSFAGVAWELDRTAQRLAHEGKATAPIVVGISNRGSKNRRPNDYFPEKALGYIAESDRKSTHIFRTCSNNFLGDEHARFVAEELKPLVDSLYRTLPDRAHTFAMGSSMGALASLYLMCEYPDTFGGAACLSTHWIGSLDLNSDYTMNDDPVCARALLDYMREHLPSPDTHLLYLDQGTRGWDAGYLAYEGEARGIAEKKGYSTAGGTLRTYDAIGADHNEWFWQQRAERPLSFLLDPSRVSWGAVESVEISAYKPDTFIDLNGRVFTDRTTLSPGIYIVPGSAEGKIVVR